MGNRGTIFLLVVLGLSLFSFSGQAAYSFQIPEQEHSFADKKIINHKTVMLYEDLDLQTNDDRKSNNESKQQLFTNKQVFLAEQLQFSINNFDQVIVNKVKQSSDRLTIMERINPLERSRVIEKSNSLPSLEDEEYSPYTLLALLDYSSKQSELSMEQFFKQLEKYLDSIIPKQHTTDHLYNSNIFNEEHLQNHDHALANSAQGLSHQHNQFAIFVLLPFIAFVLVRTENERIRFKNYKQFYCSFFIIILLSSAVITPTSISSSYFPTAYAVEHDQDISNSTNSSNSTSISNSSSVLSLYQNVTSSDGINSGNVAVSRLAIEQDPFVESFPILDQVNVTVTSSPLQIGDESASGPNYIAGQSQNLPSENISFSDIANFTLKNGTLSYNPEFTDNLVLSDLIDTFLSRNGTAIKFSYLEENLALLDMISWNLTTQELVNATNNSTMTVPNATEIYELGGNQYIQAHNTMSNLTSATIAAWIKPDYNQGSTELTVVSKEKLFSLTINNFEKPQKKAKLSLFDGYKWASITSISIIEEDWTHLAATFNNSTFDLYVNGIHEASATIPKTPYISVQGRIETKTPEEMVSESDLVVGTYIDSNKEGDGKHNQFHGLIEHVQLYDSYLNSKLISQLYNQGLAEYLSPTENTSEQTKKLNDIQTFDLLGKIQQNSTDTNVTANNSSNSTNPSVLIYDNYLTVTEEQLNANLTKLTISTWIDPDYSGGSPEYTVVGKERSFILSVNNILSPKHIPKFSVYDGIGWTEITGTSQIEDLTHLVSVIDGSTILLYVNATLENEEILPDPFLLSERDYVATKAEVAGSNSDVIIGAYKTTTRGEIKMSNKFSGTIGQVMIYKDALSLQQIEDVYSTNMASDTTTASDIVLVHNTIEIGKPVTWTQQVELSDKKNSVAIELPGDAQVLEVTMVDEYENQTVVEENSYTQSTNNETNTNSDVAVATLEKNIPDMIQEEMPKKLIVVNKSAQKYTVKYETLAPYTIEEDNSVPGIYNKKVTVAHNSTLHYIDVKSYSDIPEELVAQGVKFKLYWNINGTKTDVTDDPRFQVELVDTDDNGIEDQMRWIVPKLSEQKFEIEANIVIINVQSYPTVGGNWIVRFTTLGTADLIITGVNGTTFGQTLPDDLKFLELNNGTHILKPIISGNSIIYHNYSSSQEGFEVSKVLSTGKHHLEFRFGNDVEFAHNEASPQTRSPTQDSASIATHWDDRSDAQTSNDIRANATKDEVAQWFGFGFNIPNDVTIVGITVSLEAFLDGTGTYHIDAQLVDNNGDPVGNTNSTTALPTDVGSETILTLGGSSDLWGTTLDADTVNSNNFGVKLTAVQDSGSPNREINLDHIQITVHLDPSAKQIFLSQTLPLSDSITTAENLSDAQILVENKQRTAIIDNDNTELVIMSQTAALNTVIIQNGAADTFLNYNNIPTENTVTIGTGLIIRADILQVDGFTDVEITLGDNTVITGPDGWNRLLALPTVAEVNIPAQEQGTTTTTFSDTLAIEIGFDNNQLLFDKPVRIAFAERGNAGLLGFFERTGVTTIITTKCDDDSATVNGSPLAAGNECVIEEGSDFIIWTTHLTRFGTTKSSSSTSSSPSPSSGSSGGGGRTGVGPSGGSGGGGSVGFGARLTQPVTLYEISYDVCENNMITVVAGTQGESKPPLVKIRTPQRTVYLAELTTNQPYSGLNEISPIKKFVFMATLDSDQPFFIVSVEQTEGQYPSQVSKLVNIDGCKDTLIFESTSDLDQVAIFEPILDPDRPQIFDVKYQVGDDSGWISPELSNLYVDRERPLNVSAIIYSTSELQRVELRSITTGQSYSEYVGIRMNIQPIDGIENSYTVAAEIPTDFILAPGIIFWIHAINGKELVQDSTRYEIGVRPDITFNAWLELDSILNKEQGKTFMPTAYVFNDKDIPIFGSVSLLIDGKIVYTSTEQVFDADNPAVDLRWNIPKTKEYSSYKVNARLHVYDKVLETDVITLNTFPHSTSIPISEPLNAEIITDEFGDIVAGVAVIYSSHSTADNLNYRVVAPDGTCLIGTDDSCWVKESTISDRGNVKSIEINGQIYRVRYSGSDNPLERFSIASIDPIVGEWFVTLESDDGLLPSAHALENIDVKIKYNSQRADMVTVLSS